MLDGIRRRRVMDGILVMLILLILLLVPATLVWGTLNLPPRDAKPVEATQTAEPGLTQLEDHELSQGILHVFTWGDTPVLVYEGKQTVMVMGEAGLK